MSTNNIYDEVKELEELYEDIKVNLEEFEQRVIRLRYGLIDKRLRTLVEVGNELNLSREEIRQTEVKAYNKLNEQSKETLSKLVKNFKE